jgi:hypothetical protein
MLAGCLTQLQLEGCSVMPLTALPRLGFSRSLAELKIDAAGLIGGEPDEAGAEGAAAGVALLRAAIVPLFALAGWRGRLVVKPAPFHPSLVLEALQDLAEMGDFAALGVTPSDSLRAWLTECRAFLSLPD